jgi:hypothetical protein
MRKRPMVPRGKRKVSFPELPEEEVNSPELDIITKGPHSLIRLPDGSVGKSDLTDLFEKADFLASTYGLGNHETFTSFVKMVNEEDPIIISGLMLAATERLRLTYGGKKRKAVGDSDVDVGLKGKTGKNIYDDSKGTINNRNGFIRFLRSWGATKEEIKNAEEKIKSGKVKIPKEDFDWITPEKLNDPNFPMQDVLKRMKEARKGTININVSFDKMIASQAENRNA